MTSARDGDSDGALARRAAAGDEPAFGTLMRRHKDSIYRTLRRLTGDPDEAYDLAQEAFVSAWRNIARFDPERPFLPWVQRIALNKVRDAARRRAVRRFLLGPATDDEVLRVVDDAPLQDAQLEGRQAVAQLDRAIADLPYALRAPLVLTALEGLSHAEAGTQLGISAKAVETKVARARRQLATMLLL
ncbi:RNA polymerase sigma factor [Sandaracinobacteroides hominis]|uniref:RNA polymerase sigma factor n=1 Tax=Sandaracinobacteroides hominis TaxID=2780086 RepID=UPI0018F61261|nr:sigma-70 family RNA polymerase sigma factor [Sandaracinobacteroides hominis]